MMLSKIAHGLLRLGGWTIVGGLPPVKKAVLIAAPHTSNWDGFWLIVFKIAVGLQLRFFAKHTLFWWPLGNLLAALGAVPVDRAEKKGAVQRALDEFAANDDLYFAMAPEGTRSWKPYWRTGFYRIALGAKVPVMMGFIDYKAKTLGLVKLIELTGDPATDIATIREFYAPIHPRHPKNQGPIEFPPSLYKAMQGEMGEQPGEDTTAQ